MDRINEITRLWKLYDLCITASGDNEFHGTEPIHEEEAEWVFEALSNSFILPSEKVKSITFYLFGCALNRDNGEQVNDIIDVLHELKEITENMDNAKDFVKLGGLDIVEWLIVDRNDTLRCNALELLGIINQNDYFCQIQSVNKNLIETILQLIPMETDAIILGKLIYAISCTVRGNQEAFHRFAKLSGFELMLDQFLSSSSPRIRCKIAFFLQSLCAEMDLDQISMAVLERCVNDFVDRIIAMTSLCEPEVEYLLGAVYRIMVKYSHIVPKQRFAFANVIHYQNDSDMVEESCNYIKEIVPLLRSRDTAMLK